MEEIMAIVQFRSAHQSGNRAAAFNNFREPAASPTELQTGRALPDGIAKQRPGSRQLLRKEELAAYQATD